MVGVARSKACKTCRARRKKCDEKRPKCGLCERRGLECSYKNDLNVVFFVAPGAKLKHETYDRDSDDQYSPASMSSDSSDSSPEDLPVSCLKTSYRLQVRSCFFDAYFPGSTTLPHTTTWLRSANDLSSSDQLLSVSLDALAFSNIERQSFGPLSLPQSQILYGQAVRGLKARLSSDDGVLEDTTLATVMVLTAYESHTATKAGMEGFLPHIKAAAKLVQLRGQRNNSSDFARKLFLGTRLWGFVSALAHRKAVELPTSYLSDNSENDHSSFARLFDILIAIPAIFEQGDPINTRAHELNEEELNSAVSTMAYMYQDLESRFTGWYNHLLCVEGNGEEANLFYHKLSTIYMSLPAGSPAGIYTTYLTFCSLDIAQQLILYWSGLLLLNLFINTVERALRRQSFHSISLWPTEAARGAAFHRMHELATNITQSLEYFVHPDMGMATVDVLGMPMNLVYGFWNGMKAQETLWFDAIFAQLRQMNTGSAEFIEGMVSQGGGRVAFRSMILRKPPEVVVC